MPITAELHFCLFPIPIGGPIPLEPGEVIPNEVPWYKRICKAPITVLPFNENSEDDETVVVLTRDVVSRSGSLVAEGEINKITIRTMFPGLYYQLSHSKNPQ